MSNFNTAFSVLDTTGQLKKIFEIVIKHWMESDKDGVTEFLRYMKEKRDAMAKETAMTNKKHFMHKGSIPPNLCAMIGVALANEDVCDENLAANWYKIPEFANPFFQVFKIGCFNKSDLTIKKGISA